MDNIINEIMAAINDRIPRHITYVSISGDIIDYDICCKGITFAHSVKQLMLNAVKNGCHTPRHYRIGNIIDLR